MIRSAVIYGPNDEWRGELRRVWDAALPLLVTCMVNPSDADGERDDPTVLTLCHFGRLWGYGGLWVVNENDFRSPSPAVMRAAADPRGPRNLEFLTAALAYAQETDGRALAAWGNHGTPDNYFTLTARLLDVRLVCLGTTLSGAPKHPLARGVHRIPRDTMPMDWPA